MLLAQARVQEALQIAQKALFPSKKDLNEAERRELDEVR